MTAVPKAVIQLALAAITLIALAVVAGDIVLIALELPLLPAELNAIPVAVVAGITGMLSLRTTPELQPGATLTGGQTTLSAPPAFNPTTGEQVAASVPPVTAPAPVTVVNTADDPVPVDASPQLAASPTEPPGLVDPATIPGYS